MNKLYDIQYEEIVEGNEVAYVISFLLTETQANYFTRTIRHINLIHWMTNNDKYKSLPIDSELDEDGNFFPGHTAYEMYLETYFNEVVSDWILETCKTPELTKELVG